jgi:FlaA1/EpsC-like NDP-sugar epimerase
MNVDGKRILITGGTGSLGHALVKRLLTGDFGAPESIVVFSRDEAKQHAMRLLFSRGGSATDEVIYHNFTRCLRFRIGDVRDRLSLRAAVSHTDIVFHAAALKQVPTCEYFPEEAQATNIGGAVNLVSVLRDLPRPVETVVGISTDKAVKPVNVMGMTKAIQERILIRANLECPETRFVVARYGNVLASRGSVVPLFLEQIRHGGPLTVTEAGMTRFLMSVNDAVDTIAAAVRMGGKGETIIPRIPSVRMVDLARCLIGDRKIEVKITGIRPGEKLHEILISEEERHRTVSRGNYFAIRPMLPELQAPAGEEPVGLEAEFSSADTLLSESAILDLLARNRLSPSADAAEQMECLA